MNKLCYDYHSKEIIFRKFYNCCVFVIFLVLLLSSSTYNVMAQGSPAQDSPLTQITGKVTAHSGEPLAGATVTYTFGKTTLGASADATGYYQLQVPSLQGSLKISLTGFATKNLNLDGRSSIDVVLDAGQEQKLEEVVVSTGYNQINRKLFTGAAVKINLDDIKVEGITDVSKNLEGRVAGVSIQSPSGTFGASPRIRIRGTTSLSGNQTPLFVIDGVVLENLVDISADDLSSGNANTILGSSIAGLNPDDVVSFQVLKDASATSLYGARARNGVIVITTKSGKFNTKPTISYNASFNIGQKPSYDQYNIMNSADQMGLLLDMYRKGLLSLTRLTTEQNGGPFWSMYNAISTVDTATGEFFLENTESAKSKFLSKYANANTDWFGLLFKNNLMQTHSVSISSGGDNSAFYASLSYLNDNGQTIADKVERITANLKQSVQIRKKITIAFQVNASIRDQLTPSADALTRDVVSGGTPTRTFDINPYLFAYNTSRAVRAYDDNGNLEYVKKNYANFNIFEETANNFNTLKALDILAQVNVGYTIVPGLKYEFTGSVRHNTSVTRQTITEKSNYANAYRANDNQHVNENNKFLYTNPDDLTAPKAVVLPVGGFYRQTTNEIINYYMRNTLSWNKKISNKHELNVFAGQELRYIDRTYSFLSAPGVQYTNGYVTGNFDPLFFAREKQLGSSMLELNNASSIPRERALAYFLNVAYNFDQRFTVNVTGRYDGSNQLGRSERVRWLPTWNVSASWNIINEAFMEKLVQKNVFSQLKIRGTYGLTASTGSVSNALVKLTSQFGFRSTVATRENQIVVSSLANNDLTWEKQYELNLGLDFGLFNDRVSFVGDVYFRDGVDVIATLLSSGIGGETFKRGNYLKTTSNGAEFSLFFNNILGKLIKNFVWNMNIIYSYNETQVVDLSVNPRITDITANTGSFLKGRPIGAIYSVKFHGLDDNGIPQFINEEGKVGAVNLQATNGVEYLKYEGTVNPPTTGGWNNTFSYKGFSLNIFFSYQFGNKVRIPFALPGDDIQAATTQWKNRWILPGDESITTQPTIPGSRVLQEYGSSDVTLQYGSYALSQETIADGSFVRLKSLSLGYTFPESIFRSALDRLSVKFTVSNLALFFTDTKLGGLDPEFVNSGGVALPIQTLYTFSLNITL